MLAHRRRLVRNLAIKAHTCRPRCVAGNFGLDAEADPQNYSIGIKELWQLPEGRVKPGKIFHSFGWPADSQTYGGSFIYHLDKDRIALGYVVGLDYADPEFTPFEAFQQLKHHPMVRDLLEGGEILSSGARAIVEGGYQALPRTEMPGALLIGDAAGLLNVPKVKGTHQAVRSGMLAAEHIAETSSSAGFDQKLRASPIFAELHKVRNIRPAFYKGLWRGFIRAAIETITAGKLPSTLRLHADHTALKKVAEYTAPDRDWVNRDHLQILEPDICTTRCVVEYDNPCTRFCPASVYEMVEDTEGKRLQINSANCVHCKTCDIKDPYQVINWVTPEGAAGPNYQNL